MCKVCSGASVLQVAFPIAMSEFLIRCNLKEEGLGSQFEGRVQHGGRAEQWA